MITYEAYFTGLAAFIREPQDEAQREKIHIVFTPGMPTEKHLLYLMVPLDTFVAQSEWGQENGKPDAIVETPDAKQHCLWRLAAMSELSLWIKKSGGEASPVNLKVGKMDLAPELGTVHKQHDLTEVDQERIFDHPSEKHVTARMTLGANGSDGELVAEAKNPQNPNYASGVRWSINLNDGDILELRSKAIGAPAKSSAQQVFKLEARAGAVAPSAFTLVNLPQKAETKTVHHFKWFYELSKKGHVISNAKRKLPGDGVHGGGPIWCTPVRLFKP